MSGNEDLGLTSGDAGDFDAVAAISAILDAKPEAQPAKPEIPAAKAEPEPPDDEAEPEQETQEEEESPLPSAELEGGIVEQKTEQEEKPAVERKAEKPAPETEAKSDAHPDETLLTQLNQYVPQLQATFYTEFADIKSDADLFKVGQEDPARYNRFILQQSQLARALEAQRNLESGKQQRFIQSQVAELQKSFPDYVDPVKGAALRAEFTAFAKKRGFTDERMRSASAAEILTLRDAMAWEKHKAAQAAKPAEVAAAQAKAKEKAAKAPQVQKPGVPEHTSGKVDRVKEKVSRFEKSGHVNDLADVFREAGI